MNEVLECLFRRKSVRVFTEEPVSAAEKRTILEAAAQAPTAGNQQLYTILDITDQAIKEVLSDSCDHQPFIAQAPVVLIFCADCLRWWNAYVEAGCEPRKPGAGDLMLAFSDACIAAQNAVTAAESLGLGSCYIGDILEQYEIHRELLHLPEWVMPAAMLVIGWPVEQQKRRPKPERFSLDGIVQQNRYTPLEGEELQKMFASRAGEQGFSRWVQAFWKRKYESSFSREMTRSVECYWREFQGERSE